MKKLAIYGDSFTDPYIIDDESIHLKNTAWVNLLKSDYDVTLYGKAGSSIYYSFSLFKKTYHLYDKILFLPTSHTRWPVAIDNNRFYPGLSTVTQDINTLSLLRNTFRTNKQLHALKGFYQYLLTESMEESMKDWSRLMINDIKHTRSDTVFIEYECMTADYLLAFHRNLNGIPLDILNSQVGIYGHYTDFRTCCHFSEEVNQVVYCDALAALKTGTWTVNIPEIIPHKNSFDYYFKKIS